MQKDQQHRHEIAIRMSAGVKGRQATDGHRKGEKAAEMPQNRQTKNSIPGGAHVDKNISGAKKTKKPPKESKIEGNEEEEVMLGVCHVVRMDMLRALTASPHSLQPVKAFLNTIQLPQTMMCGPHSVDFKHNRCKYCGEHTPFPAGGCHNNPLTQGIS